MDIEKEREAFEELIDIEIIISEGFKFNPNINQYYHPDHTNHRLSYAYLMGAWMVWQEKAQAVPECTWTKNEDGYFDASCGQSFVFSEPEDKPSSHEFTHCCFCGGKLIEVKEPTND